MIRDNPDQVDLQYSDLLSDSPTEAVLMLDDPEVEIDNYSKQIVVPESYADSGIDSFINQPLGTVKKNVENNFQDAYRKIKDSNPVGSPFYHFGKEREESAEDTDSKDFRHRIWDAEDDHRKSAYATTTAFTGFGASVASQKEEAAAAFGAATAGVAAFNSYSRGRRDDMLEEAVSGLSEAYGEYDIEFKEDDRRSERIRKVGEGIKERTNWVRDTLEAL